MKHPALLILTVAAAIMLLPACKPTEKNYKAAYEAAKQKQKRDAEDPDILIPAGGLIDDDAPKATVINGITVNLRYEALKHISGAEMNTFNVAIAAYKMTANALSHWERIKDQYAGALVVQNSKELFYVCIGTYAGKEEAAEAAAAYSAKHPDALYPGLDANMPVIEAAIGR